MSGKKYFDKRNPKGEVAEWKSELSEKGKAKDALKKIIAAMTIGKDVSAVFAEVTSCSQTADLELKKLVYLYLINYAKTQPELAIMAVNTFVKDANDHNPMLRALAIRTMGCIRVDRITEYLCDPLERALKDQDPYVRKTAAICVAKLNDMSPDLVRDRGFLDMLRDMMNDANPMVVSNAVASLAEIFELNGGEAFAFSRATSAYLLSAMEQSTEWGQVYILECLAAQKTDNPEEADTLITRTLSRLQHANSAVVLAAVKSILSHLPTLTAEDRQMEILRKLAAPLVTLLSQRSEVQYVALRNINLILQRYPEVLATEARVFYCKYNDPIYVKLEKLEIMVMLASDANISGVLAELKEYAQEVDVDFVRKAVSCIGQVALRLEGAAQRCVEALMELVKLKVAYVVQEAVVVIKDIFRCYPNKYESVIADLCEALSILEEPDAKAAMIWIVGEYAHRIDNADELLSFLLDTFLDEPVAVQLQLLTATVKLFLKKPGAEGAQAMISRVLTAATQQTDNPDLRDRAYLYWRMLSSMPEDAQKVVLADKPTIKDTSLRLDPELRDELLRNLSTLSSVYHKLPHTFVKRQRAAVQALSDLEAKRNATEDSEERGSGAVDASATAVGDSSSMPGEAGVGPSDVEPDAASPGTAPPVPSEVDLLGGLDDEPEALPRGVRDPNDDLLGGLDGLSIVTPAIAPEAAAPPADPFGLSYLSSQQATTLPIIADASTSQGCEVHGTVVLENGQYLFHTSLTNRSEASMSGFHVQFNKNVLGLGVSVGDTALDVGPLAPGETQETKKAMLVMPEKVDPSLGNTLQIALKWSELQGVPFVMLQASLPQAAPDTSSDFF